jgi:hypothetical protein
MHTWNWKRQTVFADTLMPTGVLFWMTALACSDFYRGYCHRRKDEYGRQFVLHGLKGFFTGVGGILAVGLHNWRRRAVTILAFTFN